MNQKLPPQNLDAEKSVIGAVLIDANALSKVADTLKPEHFYSPQHALIFGAIINLFHAAKPIDVVTVTDELKKQQKLRQAGGSAYLSEVIAEVPTAAHLVEYANIVREASVRRSLISFAGSLTDNAHEEQRELDEILNELEGQIFSLSQDNTQRGFLSAAELVEMHFEKTEEYSKNPNALRGLSTGLRSVDAMLGGLHNSDLIIVAARPSVGKTSFALDLARHVAVEGGKSVAVFSLEMPAIQVIERMLAQQINVGLWDLRMGKMTDEGYARFAEGAGRLSESKLFVDDSPGITIGQLRSKARKLKLEQGLDMIVLDYLQLMQGSGKYSDSRAYEISEISQGLKLLARELNIPLIALAQLNRAVENRSDHIPQLSDLRDSGSIEQDADLVMFLSREKLFNPDTERQDSADVFIAKHRNGPIGKIELRFIEDNTKFVDLD
jgi:replicative DNA helicase